MAQKDESYINEIRKPIARIPSELLFPLTNSFDPFIFHYLTILNQQVWFIEVCTKFRWGNLRETDHWGDQDVDGRIILRWIFRMWEGVVWAGWSWLRIRTGGGRL